MKKTGSKCLIEIPNRQRYSQRQTTWASITKNARMINNDGKWNIIENDKEIKDDWKEESETGKPHPVKNTISRATLGKKIRENLNKWWWRRGRKEKGEGRRTVFFDIEIIRISKWQTTQTIRIGQSLGYSHVRGQLQLYYSDHLYVNAQTILNKPWNV